MTSFRTNYEAFLKCTISKFSVCLLILAQRSDWSRISMSECVDLLNTLHVT